MKIVSKGAMQLGVGWYVRKRLMKEEGRGEQVSFIGHRRGACLLSIFTVETNDYVSEL